MNVAFIRMFRAEIVNLVRINDNDVVTVSRRRLNERIVLGGGRSARNFVIEVTEKKDSSKKDNNGRGKNDGSPDLIGWNELPRVYTD